MDFAKTHELTGDEIAGHAERLVAGSVERTTPGACYFKPERVLEIFEALRTDRDSDFVHLTNLCGVDYWDRLEVVYHVQSFVLNQIATLKVELTDRENPVCPSVVPVWWGAWMQENEAYDMYGIKFEGHPNLYRILLWEGFPGWPLRKDFLSMPGGLQPGLNEFAGVSRRAEPPVRVVEE
jgi:NADH-quinone oxidoreductase subunit C